MCLIHDIMESWLHWQKKLDFEMAKKIPVPAVLSFWSIKGIAIPLSSHAKNFLFLNRANAYFSKRSDFYHIYKPFIKSFKKPVNNQIALAIFLLKNTNANYPIATEESKLVLQRLTVIGLTKDFGHGRRYTSSRKPCFLAKYASFH